MQFQARPSLHTNVSGLLCTSSNRVVIQQMRKLLCARPEAGCIKVTPTAIHTALQSLRGAQHGPQETTLCLADPESVMH